jgi:peptidoglycan/xylan/chitin deacetylase (PgdA/CDA1 family)
VGVKPTLVRPPNGKLTVAKLWGLLRSEHTIVLWNVDPRDWACRTGSEVLARFERRPLRAGDVLLMHDNRPQTVAALPEVIAGAQRNGLRFVTVSHWLNHEHNGRQARKSAVPVGCSSGGRQ